MIMILKRQFILTAFLKNYNYEELLMSPIPSHLLFFQHLFLNQFSNFFNIPQILLIWSPTTEQLFQTLKQHFYGNKMRRCNYFYYN